MWRKLFNDPIGHDKILSPAQLRVRDDTRPFPLWQRVWLARLNKRGDTKLLTGILYISALIFYLIADVLVYTSTSRTELLWILVIDHSDYYN